MVMNDPHLVLGHLDMLGPSPDGSYTIETLGADQGTDWGNYELIVQTMDSFMRDGSLSNIVNYDDRTLILAVKISGANLAAIAAGENTLFLECAKAGSYGSFNELTWTPSDGFGASAVFEITLAKLEHAYDDVAEGSELPYRVFKVTLTAAPFVKSVNSTTVSVGPPPSGEATAAEVDDCSTTAGWTSQGAAGFGEADVTEDDGGVRVRRFELSSGHEPVPGPATLVLTRSGLAEDMSTTPYLRVDAEAILGNLVSGSFAFRITGAGAVGEPDWNAKVVTPVAQAGSGYWLDLTGLATLATVGVSAEFTSSGKSLSAGLRVNDITRSSTTVPAGTTNRELFATLPIGGVVRTPASIALTRELAEGFGDVLIFSCPASAGIVQPPLRQYLTSVGDATPDSSTISGAYSNLTEVHTFLIPVTGVPKGAYELVARVRAHATGTRVLTWQAAWGIGEALPADPDQTGTVTFDATDTEWHLITLAHLNLPTRLVGPAGSVYIGLFADGDVDFDEGFICNIDVGSMTRLPCGSGPVSPGTVFDHVWIDPPSVANPSPQIWLGTTDDRSDALHAGPVVESWGAHEFPAGAVNIFTACTEAEDRTITLDFTARWPTHPEF